MPTKPLFTTQEWKTLPLEEKERRIALSRKSEPSKGLPTRESILLELDEILAAD